MKKLYTLLLLSFLSGCNVYVFHDWDNPCYKMRTQDQLCECEQFKKNNPRMYKHYQERLKKDSILHSR